MVDWKNPRVMATEARMYLCRFLTFPSSNATGICSRLQQRGPRVLWVVYVGTHSLILL